MRNLLTQLKKIFPVTIFVTVLFLPHIASANILTDFVLPWSTSYVASIVSFVGYMILSALSVVVTAAGLFLSISINITLHIKDIYDKMVVVRDIWIIMRDLSSIFIIFILLYYSIRTIIGQADGKAKELIIKVFLAGVFINFSLFFVRIGVDASNLVSLQFYNAIAPETSQAFSTASAYYDGGLSNIFMQSLGITRIYSTATLGQGLDAAASVFFSIIGGIILMVTAAISFFAASIAFTVRTAVIFFIMALSPLYFAGIIFPGLKKSVSDRLLGLLKSQLIFMPVYLALMYVALRLISDPSFNAVFGKPVTSVADKAEYAYTWTGIIIQYVIAIIFINIPLVAAIKLSGETGFLMKWAPQAGSISKRIGGFFGRNIGGRSARYVGESMDNLAASGRMDTLLKSKPMRWTGAATALRTGRDAVRHGLETAEKAKYGGPKSLKEREEQDKKYDKEVAEIRHGLERRKDFDKVHGEKTSTHDDYKKVLSKMNTKELEGLKEKLADKKIASALSPKQAEAILKSDISESEKDKFKIARMEGFKDRVTEINSGDWENILKEDFDEDQKNLLKDEREKQLSGLSKSGDRSKIEAYMKKISGKELMKLKDQNLLKDPSIVAFYTPSQLNEMRDLKGDTKKWIGDRITDFEPASHPSKGWIRKNRSEWS